MRHAYNIMEIRNRLYLDLYIINNPMIILQIIS